MNAIDRIKKRFEIKLPYQPATEPASPAPPPCQCGHAQHWRAHHQTQWRCGRCTPPPARSLVAEWWPVQAVAVGGDSRQLAVITGEHLQPSPAAPQSPQIASSPPRVTSESHVTFCKPWCEQCGGWRGIERTYSDESHTIHCLTCKSELPEIPRERPAKEKNKNHDEEIAA
jgi:hypothetical protein